MAVQARVRIGSGERVGPAAIGGTVHHLARLTFWSVNRDRSCPSGTTAGDTCSGIAQPDLLFTTLTAGYTG